MPITGTLAADFSDFDKAVRVSAAELEKFESSATRTTSAFSTLGTSLAQVDRLAALAGVRLGPVAAAMSELGAIVTMTSGAMATLGPVALAVGAALATLKVAELVRDYTTFDETLTDVIYSMTGWTKGTKEASTAQDELARASAWSGVKITDLTVAMQLNAEAARIAGLQAAELARYEERAAEESDKLHDRFVARFRERSAAQDAITRQANEANRAFTNFINERLIADHARALEQQARDEEAWREYQNFLGQRHMEEEAARLQAEADLHAKAVADFAALEKTKYQDYISITGAAGTGELERPQSLLRPQSLSQRGFVGFGEEGATPAVAFPSGGGTTVNNITMSGMLLSDDPSSLDKLRGTISRALKPTINQSQYHPSS